MVLFYFPILIKYKNSTIIDRLKITRFLTCRVSHIRRTVFIQTGHVTFRHILSFTDFSTNLFLYLHHLLWGPFLSIVEVIFIGYFTMMTPNFIDQFNTPRRTSALASTEGSSICILPLGSVCISPQSLRSFGSTCESNLTIISTVFIDF